MIVEGPVVLARLSSFGNFKRDLNNVIQGNTFESIVCEMAAILIAKQKKTHSTLWSGDKTILHNTVKPVCNDHLYNKIYYLWFIQ